MRLAGAFAQGRGDQRGSADGFTLVEVLLAAGIAAALLLVVLFFHQQTAGMRNGLLAEGSRLTAVRQLMARLTRELACAAPGEGALQGDLRSIEFVWRKPSPLADDLRAPALPELCRVRYESSLDEESGETTPLRRAETPLAQAETPPAEPESGSVYALMDQASEGAEREGGGATYTEIRFAQFRFWDGESWLESWAEATPPFAVEVVLGFRAAEEAVTGQDYAHELFRRSIPMLVMGPVQVPVAGPRPATNETASAEAANPGRGRAEPDEGRAPPPGSDTPRQGGRRL